MDDRKWVSEAELYKSKIEKNIQKTRSLPNLQWKAPAIDSVKVGPAGKLTTAGLSHDVVRALYAERQFLPGTVYQAAVGDLNSTDKHYSPGIVIQYALTIIPFIDLLTDYLNAGIVLQTRF